jgi:ferric-chelate reductase (NADPH)
VWFVSSIMDTTLLLPKILKLFTRSAQVLDIEDIGSAFRIVTLGGEALRNVSWTPGDKIQIQLGGWSQRTYTPMGWDPASGRTRILVYLHGDAPGAQWMRTLNKGDSCMFFGPRASIKLARPNAPVILFGDETALGLAFALSRQVAPLAMQALVEVSTLAEAKPVIERLRLHQLELCARQDSDVHLGQMGKHMSALVQAHADAEIVLAGKAGSIQHMRRLVRQQGPGSQRVQSKAYWATGKTGLD